MVSGTAKAAYIVLVSSLSCSNVFIISRTSDNNFILVGYAEGIWCCLADTNAIDS